MTTPALCGAATLFVVQDVLLAVEHYRDVLGFHTEFTYGQPTFYAGVERDGVVNSSSSRPPHQATARTGCSQRVRN